MHIQIKTDFVYFDMIFIHLYHKLIDKYTCTYFLFQWYSCCCFSQSGSKFYKLVVSNAKGRDVQVIAWNDNIKILNSINEMGTVSCAYLFYYYKLYTKDWFHLVFFTIF